jgi:uncharacterized membrane protein
MGRPCLSVCRAFRNSGTGCPVVGIHSCATMTWHHIGARMTSDQISATTAYVMRRKERIWNVVVLQRVHLFSLVIYRHSILAELKERTKLGITDLQAKN